MNFPDIAYEMIKKISNSKLEREETRKVNTIVVEDGTRHNSYGR